ncbi:undecaprenyl-diphosphatase [Desulfurella sp.]|uniref:undecaprenyl-diphosphatase n=1 Tax=Desulfurella sp. TaxID=1962857 RepID=UPI0025B8A9FB|nr:undecaprenyl-diphosphatase [Desulfurella sp.]
MNLNDQIFLAINNLSLLNIGILNFFCIFVALFSPYIYALGLVIVYLSNRKKQALCAFYVALIGLSINFLIGIFYYHPRPFVEGLGNLLIPHAKDSSFPSDHATLAFAISFGFWYAKEKIISIMSFIFAIITGFARVFVGVHFPFDIVGSFFVAIVALTLLNAFVAYFSKVSDFLIKLQIRIFNMFGLNI